MISGNSVDIFEDGLESRDFVFVDDAVEATILGIEKIEAANQVFNVGTGQPISVLVVADILASKLGVSVPIVLSKNFRVGDIRHNYACMKKINRILEFRVSYDFERGISLFCNWVLSSGSKVSDYKASLLEMKQKGLMK